MVRKCEHMVQRQPDNQKIGICFWAVRGVVYKDETHCGNHTAFCSLHLLPQTLTLDQGCQDMKVTIQLHLVRRLRISGFTPPLLHTFSCSVGPRIVSCIYCFISFDTFTFPLIISMPLKVPAIFHRLCLS